MPFNNKTKNLLLLFAFATLAIAVSSCKQKKQEEQISEETPMYYSEEFKAFYDQFSTDSTFQLEHIVFPLEGRRRQKDSLDIIPDDFRWQMEDWKIHRPFDDMNGTYSREWLDVSGIVVERISDYSNTYSMERRFGKLSAGWHLIYYQEMDMN
jgi:hypothetical protein